MTMLYSRLALVLFLSFFFVGCAPHESQKQREAEANSAAGKAGKVAYGVAKETGRAAEKVGHQLSIAAHEAHEGWKEAAAEDTKKHAK